MKLSPPTFNKPRLGSTTPALRPRKVKYNAYAAKAPMIKYMTTTSILLNTPVHRDRLILPLGCILTDADLIWELFYEEARCSRFVTWFLDKR
jgi:hypothetical protein